MYSTNKRTINSEEETYTCTVDQHINNGEKKQVWQLGHHHSYEHGIVTNFQVERVIRETVGENVQTHVS